MQNTFEIYTYGTGPLNELRTFEKIIHLKKCDAIHCARQLVLFPVSSCTLSLYGLGLRVLVSVTMSFLIYIFVPKNTICMAQHFSKAL
jgi:hypothetical protein